MGKPNKRHHELCLKYKTEGRREKNKKIRAEKHQRLLAKFAKRRESKGIIKNDYIPKDPEIRGLNKEPKHKDSAFTPKQKHMDEYSAFRSFMKRTRNQLDAVALAEKKEAMGKKNIKGGNKNDADK